MVKVVGVRLRSVHVRQLALNGTVNSLLLRCGVVLIRFDFPTDLVTDKRPQFNRFSRSKHG